MPVDWLTTALYTLLDVAVVAHPFVNGADKEPQMQPGSSTCPAFAFDHTGGAILRAVATHLELHQYLAPVGTGGHRVCDTGLS